MDIFYLSVVVTVSPTPLNHKVGSVMRHETPTTIDLGLILPQIRQLGQ